MDFEILEAILKEIDAETEASECHGTLCGMLCADRQINEHRWLLLLVGEQSQVDRIDLSAKRALLALFHETIELLNDPDLSFTPLLPSDEAILHERVVCLGEWCAGFIYGLSLGGLQDLNKLPADSSEIVQDILDISRVHKIEEEDESGENDYFELKEYIRMGVVLIHEELQPHAPEPEQRVLH